MDEAGDSVTVQVHADTQSFRNEMRLAEYAGARFGRSLSNAFEGLIFKGKSLGDTLRSLALSLSRVVLQAAFKPLQNGFGSLLSGLFSAQTKAFSHGGVVQRAMPVPFAAGGVISSPIAFPLTAGKVGIAGERGAEAIMPLARGSDGRLGVRSDGGGGVTVTFNVQSPDAESFKRSETQIAAMLARAVGRGQRNL